MMSSVSKEFEQAKERLNSLSEDPGERKILFPWVLVPSMKSYHRELYFSVFAMITYEFKICDYVRFPMQAL